MSYFLTKFKQACQEKGTTPYQVSKEVGLPQSTASLISTGKRRPRPEHLQLIATSKQLGVSYERLMSWLALELFPIEALKEAITVEEEDRGLLNAH